ncbi:hypothetical protein [Xylocopilactobacillus apicola]|uniref:Uncharacterized protein n=1 Tax=Xylocopilactobacillus apicola TaxID=2932184 RepID=A0AAU9D7I3_9LACO|nr:hypothetical protein [Xylocopilactobacillus apicola]BDR59503.1 hypothetical protein XA3_19440 [Xylocopilactobacillus apicola]
MKFYAKLAKNNLRQFANIYLPFIITVSTMMMVSLVILNICFDNSILVSGMGAQSTRGLFYFWWHRDASHDSFDCLVC